MARLENEGLVINNNLSVQEFVDEQKKLQTVSIEGTVECFGGVVVRVNKRLDVQYRSDGRPEVKGVDYTYQAWLEEEEKQIIRYDMAHESGLHCHLYNLNTGEEVIKYVNLNELPTLDLFIRIAIQRAKVT